MFKKISSSFSKVSHLVKREKKKNISPDSAWKMTLLVFFALNILLLSYLIVFYIGISNESVFTISKNQDGKMEFLNEALLDETIGFYTEKEESLSTLLESSPDNFSSF